MRAIAPAASRECRERGGVSGDHSPPVRAAQRLVNMGGAPRADSVLGLLGPSWAMLRGVLQAGCLCAAPRGPLFGGVGGLPRASLVAGPTGGGQSWSFRRAGPLLASPASGMEVFPSRPGY